MTKLWLMGLAASAAIAPMAAAEAAQTVPDPDPFYGLPAMSLKANGAPAARPAARPAPRQAPRQAEARADGAPAPRIVQEAPRMAQAAPAAAARTARSVEALRTAPAPRIAEAAPAAVAARAAPGVSWHEPARVVRVVRTPAPAVRRIERVELPDVPGPRAMGGHGPAREVRDMVVRRELRRATGGHGGGMRHVEVRRRIDRGGFIPPMWMGPQFVVSNWGMYGFPQPMSGRRWVRYYDDALLVDRDGRVIDGRYGMDWDRYGDRWDYDDGVPVYAGRGGYRASDDDYGYDGYDDYAGGGRGYDEEYDEEGDCGRDRCAPAPHGPPPPPDGHGGYGGGYGCGCGPVVITETVTTTTTSSAPVAAHRRYEVVRPAPRRYRAPMRRLPPPPPPPRYDGERG